MKHYQYLNKEERFYIWNALRTGSNQKEVAQALGRTLSELRKKAKLGKISLADTKRLDKLGG